MGNHQSKAVLVVTGFLGLSLILLHATDSEDDQQASEEGVGIINLGNTCFLNALLQAFSSSAVFAGYVNSLLCNAVVDTPGHDFAIVTQLQRAVELLRTGKTHLRPEDLVSHLTYKFPHFGQQQDSHEVFLILHDALTTVRGQDSLISLLKSPTGLDPMLGLMTNTVTCLHCRNQTHTMNTFSYLYVDWKPDLVEALAEMAAGETVDYECLQCSVDKTKRELERQLSLSQGRSTLFEREVEGARIRRMMTTVKEAADSDDPATAEFLIKSKYVAKLTHTVVRLPQVLCILVKRLVYTEAGYLTKVQSHMQFPLDLSVETGLSPLLDSDLASHPVYSLTALIEHCGSALGGHYFTYKRCGEAWTYVSDTAVKRVDSMAVMRGQAYMLFYERVR